MNKFEDNAPNGEPLLNGVVLNGPPIIKQNFAESISRPPIPIKQNSSNGLNNSGSYGYMKTIQRRGNTYMIRDSLPSEDDAEEMNDTDRMSRDLYIDSIKLSTGAGRGASMFKMLYFICAFLMILGGVAVGIISYGKIDYFVSAIGFALTAIQTFLITFSIEKRGVLLKDVSNKSRKISREVRMLQTSDMKPHDKMKKLDEYYTELDDLDLTMFDNKITTAPLAKGTNIIGNPNDSSQTSGDENLYEDAKGVPSRSASIKGSSKVKQVTKLIPVLDAMTKEEQV